MYGVATFQANGRPHRETVSGGFASMAATCRHRPAGGALPRRTVVLDALGASQPRHAIHTNPTKPHLPEYGAVVNLLEAYPEWPAPNGANLRGRGHDLRGLHLGRATRQSTIQAIARASLAN